MDRIRIGIIGTANWAREAHIKNLLRLSQEAEIACLWNRGAENLEKAHLLTPASRTVSDVSELIDDSSIQAVIVSLPPHRNEELVVRALRAGKHVLCEKPLGHTVASCERMIQVANDTGKILQVGFELRYSEFYRTYKRMIDEGNIGRPAMIVFKSFSGVGWAYRQGTWIVDPELSGGAMNSWGVHPIDLLNDLAGAKPVAVYGCGDIKVRTQTPIIDNCAATIEYEGGTVATLLYCRFSPFGNDWELNVVGDRGKIDGFINRREVHHFGVENETETVVRLAPYEGDGFAGALLEVSTFLRCIREGGRPATDGNAGLAATRVALAIEQAIREKRRVTL